MKIRNLFIPILVILIGFGCIPDRESVVPSRVDVRFNVSNLDTDLGDGQDTVNINTVKILLDKFNLLTPDEDTIQTNVDGIILSFDSNNLNNDEVVFQAAIGFEDFRSFKALDVFVEKAEQTDSIFDQDLKTPNDTYSFVLKGTFNDQSFTYQSQVKFQKLFEFDPITLDENTETLQLRILTDILDFMIDRQTREILSPNNPDDIVKIDSLLEVSLLLDASATSSLPLN